MSQLNTGLILRKEYESAYGAFRRFLIANADVGYSQIIERLNLATAERCRQLTKSPTLYQKAQWFERDYCRDHNLPINAEASCTSTACTRNCQRCAEIGFHSAGYELPWLAYCPLHDEPLRETCEQCDQMWPTASELHSRQCTGCGARINIQTLINGHAFDTIFPLARLEILYECFRVADYLKCFELAPSECVTRKPSYHHQAVSVHSKFFPSVMCAIDGARRKSFDDLRVPIYPLNIYKKTFKSIIKKSISSHTEIPPKWETHVRRRVYTKIRRAIAKVAGPAHHTCLAEAGFEFSAQTTCPYCIALTIWHEYVGIGSAGNPNRNFHFGDLIYQNTNIYDIPSFPERMRILGISRAKNNYRFELDDSIQQLIYGIDLWTTFINMLHYVSYYYSGGLCQIRYEFERYLPSAAKIKNSISRDIGFFLDNENRLTVVIPKELFKNDLKKIETPSAEKIKTRWGIYFKQKKECRASADQG